MPIKNQDTEAQARSIAVDVGNRRKAGDHVSDEEVLRENPKLRVPLLEQLKRLARLETARQQAVEPEPSSAESAAAEVSTDHQGTLGLPLLADEFPSDRANDQVRQAADPPPVDKSPKSEKASPGKITQGKVASLTPAPPRSPETPPTSEAPTAAAPSEESDNPIDELRITLKEPSIDVRNQSTMVLDDSSAIIATMDESQIPRYRPTVRAPMAVVKLFHDGQTTFNHYPIMTDRFIIGREDGDLIVPHDKWISKQHAEIQRRKRGDSYHWYLVDMKSTNGTFVQTDFAVLRHHDELFLGQERYRFLLHEGRAALMHVTRGSGQQWAITESAAVIGSQPPGGLKSFATDPYLDVVHARLKREPDGTWTIRDNRSRNGVWYRVKEVEIPPNCEFQLGEQRFGFWAQVDHQVKAPNLHIASRMLDSAQ